MSDKPVCRTNSLKYDRQLLLTVTDDRQTGSGVQEEVGFCPDIIFKPFTRLARYPSTEKLLSLLISRLRE